MTQDYRKEFPDFPELDFELPEGFEDCSWHNDAMPRFCKMGIAPFLSLWVNYPNEEDREIDSGGRFTLSLTDVHQEHIKDLFFTDSSEEMLKFIADYLSPESKQALEDRINKVCENAQYEFWNSVAEQFPEIKDGNFTAGMSRTFDLACEEAVAKWVELNRESK